MAKKISKIEQMTSGNGARSGRAVFSASDFRQGIEETNTDLNGEGYQYTFVDADLIDLPDEPIEYPNALKQSVLQRMIQPVILSMGYTEKERGGRKFKSKNGRYNVVDGKKRVKILKDEGIKKVQALVLPLEVSDEEIERIKQTTAQDKATGVQEVIKDVTETLNEEITYCYRYESITVDLDKLVERENKYAMRQSEIDELEKSIYRLGLLQPIVVLPIMDARTMEVKYEIQSGHKRTRAIRQLVEHAKEGLYPGNKELIIESFKTVPALLIPMGSNAKDVEKIYHETNMLSRHMTVDDCFKVIESFDFLPTRPTTKEEFIHFKEENSSMNQLVVETQEQMKKLGFQDWKSAKTAKFLNVYYFGSDKAIDIFTNIDDYPLNQKEVYWIVTTYKDFNERSKQDDILNQAIEDKSTLRALMAEKTVRRNRTDYTVKKINDTLIRQRSTFEKIIDSEIKGTSSVDEKANARKLINETRALLMKLEKVIDAVDSE